MKTFWNSEAFFSQNNWKCLEVFMGTKGTNFIKEQ